MTESTALKPLPDLLLEADDLPSLPAVALEVLRLAQDEEADLDDLATCIGRDPALAAKLLKLSNSALFRRGEPTTTLPGATMVLGLDSVKLMALSFSLLDGLPKRTPGDGFSVDEFWWRSLVSAVAARSLARLLGNRSSEDEAFLCGLLGHLGKLVLAQCMPQEYEAVVREAGGWPGLEVEERVLGFNSADVSATLLRSWDFPDLVWLAIGFGDRPDELPGEADGGALELVGLMGAARLVEATFCDEFKCEALSTLHETAKRSHGLAPDDVDDFLVELEPAVAEMAEILDIRPPEGQRYHEVLDQARDQLLELGVRLAADLRETERRADSLEGEIGELQKLTQTDALTGLPTRARFHDLLEGRIRARMRGSMPGALGLVFIDVDRFKYFNDTYGHQTGDEVLRTVGSALKRLVRRSELPARYGGDEFAVIVPQTNPSRLKHLAERLRRAIKALVVELDGEELGVTVSVGAACIGTVRSEECAKILIERADQSLYRAKANGRNCSEVHPDFG